MKIEKWNVDIHKLKAMCPDCDIEMVRDTSMLMTSPPQYKYVCPKCRREEISIECYPKIVIK